MNIQEMICKELEKQEIKNRHILLTTTNLEEKRKLILENHEMMVEMDRKWNATEAKKEKRKKA